MANMQFKALVMNATKNHKMCNRARHCTDLPDYSTGLRAYCTDLLAYISVGKQVRRIGIFIFVLYKNHSNNHYFKLKLHVVEVILN